MPVKEDMMMQNTPSHSTISKPVAARPTLGAHLSRFWHWWLTVTTDDPVRLVLNQGLLTTLSVLLLINIAAIVAFAQDPAYLLIVLCDLSALLLAVWLTRRGTTYGAILFTLVAIGSSAAALEPQSFLVDSAPVPMILLFPVIVATLFITPRTGIWAAMLQLIGAAIALYLKGAPTSALLTILPRMAIDLGAFAAFLVVGASIFVRKIRSEIAANAALQELNATLEQQVAARTQELAASNAQLAEANTQLAAIMQRRSHELRATAHDLNSGLTVVRSAVDMLVLDTEEAGLDCERIAEAREGVERGFNSATALVNNLFTAALLESDKLELKRQDTDLAALAEGVVQQYAALAQLNECRLHFHRPAGPIQLTIDAQRMERVLANLLGNAIKYTHKTVDDTGREGVIALAVERASDGVAISITDNGIGMTAHDLERIGQSFTRLSTAQGTDGTGLGIYTSKGVVAAHGGTIIFASDGPGCGSTVTVWLPQNMAGA